MTLPTLIESLLVEAEPTPEVLLAPQTMLVGRALDTRHPVLRGRVRVALSTAAGPVEAWLPTLQNLPVRAEDRVLVAQPAGADEPIVIGVVDGFHARPELPHAAAATVELRADEAVHVIGADGAPLVEVFRDDHGPVVRLLADADLALTGGLRVSARSIALVAREGEITLQARDDVIARGETIQLNP